jgi:hypothetical protein
VTMAQGNHPFPSRTRKLSPAAPMVLPLDGGRVGRCQAFFYPPSTARTTARKITAAREKNRFKSAASWFATNPAALLQNLSFSTVLQDLIEIMERVRIVSRWAPRSDNRKTRGVPVCRTIGRAMIWAESVPH